MKRYLLRAIFFIGGFVFGQNSNQYDAIDKKMDAIPASMTSSTESIAEYISKNFSTKEDKMRAAFYWTASNISYDVANMENQNPNQTAQEKITTTLQTKKGVCMHYAEVFKDLASKIDVEVILIGGYTRILGKVSPLPHQWCAAKFDGNWYLFDPTWGAGYVENLKYVKKLNNTFFKAEPKNWIVSHMPFDYLWQFLEYPITNQEFYDGKTTSAATSVRFEFDKEIAAFQKLSDREKAKATATRMEKNGLKNKLIIERLAYEKKRITYEETKDTFGKIKDIVTSFNEANSLFSLFIKYRNNRFIPMVSDEEIKSKIEVPYNMLVQCQKDINEIKDVPRDNLANVNAIKTALSDAKKNFEIQWSFVNEYLSKDTIEREKMFFKSTTKKR